MNKPTLPSGFWASFNKDQKMVEVVDQKKVESIKKQAYIENEVETEIWQKGLKIDYVIFTKLSIVIMNGLFKREVETVNYKDINSIDIKNDSIFKKPEEALKIIINHNGSKTKEIGMYFNQHNQYFINYFKAKVSEIS